MGNSEEEPVQVMPDRQAGSMRGSEYRAAYRQLATAQKSSRGASAYSRYINRPLGRVLAAGAFVFGLSPNAVTMVSAAFTFTGLVLIGVATPGWATGIGIAAALVVGYSLDSADGQVARLRGRGSVAGEWLDHVIDSFKISAIHLIVLIGLTRFTDLGRLWLLVPLGFAIVANVTFFGKILNDQLRRRVPSDPARQRQFSLLELTLVAPTDYGVLILLFVVWKLSFVFIVCYAVLFVASLGFLAMALPRWFREIRSLDQRTPH